MDLFAVLRFYVDKMLKDVQGMKVLVLDADTTQAVSMVFSQSEILEQEVFLVEKIEAVPGQKLLHLKAVYFLRPTRENIARLRRELRSPRFSEYNLFFTNRLEDLQLQDLAETDTTERVVQLQEFFGDFEAVDQHHFALSIPRPYVAIQPFNWEFANSTEAVSRITDGLAALTLSLRRRFSVRYLRGSEMCERVAQALTQLTYSEERELFDFGQRGNEPAPVILLVDRKEDPVTPLLTQWTYQAMVHELIGIDANRVNLPAAANVKKDFREMVMSARQDEFYQKQMYSNFGDIGMAVKTLVDEFQKQNSRGQNVSSLEDMQNFVENYSEFSAAQRNASKHVTLISTLSSIVDARSLMQVSSAEQEVSCSGNSPQGHYEMITPLLNSAGISDQDRIRLVLLYALRYETEGRKQVAALMSALQDQGLSRSQLGLLKTLLQHMGAEKRTGDLYSNRTFSSRFVTLAKQNLRGVENVYTQHTPLILNTLEQLVKGKLKDSEYGNSGQPFQANTSQRGQRLVIVFMIGGTTYEEAKAIADLNIQAEKGEGWAAGSKFLLGGTGVLNSTNFLKLVEELHSNEKFS